MNILTPSGQMDAALQSMFRKAQMSDEAVQAAEHVSQMEMENNVQHNMECAALVSFHSNVSTSAGRIVYSSVASCPSEIPPE